MGVEKVEFLDANNKIKETKDKKNAKAFNALPEHIRVQTLHKAEKLYRERAEAFEFGLAKKAETNKEILKQADEMLGKLRTMADAWAKSTGQTADQVYEKSFGSNSSVLYYGAIKGTADNIKQIFDNAKSMPLRLKYGILYRCILSGTFTKWMKTLALQIVNPNMEVASKRGKNKEVSKNFIGALQANNKNALVSLGLLKKEEEGGHFTDQLKDIYKGIMKDKKSKTGTYKFGREGVLNQTEAVKKGHDIRSGHYSNLTKDGGIESFGEESLRHLRIDELSTKLTSMERDALEEKENGIDSKGVIRGWTQGAEDNSLIHGTEITKQVNEFKARVVAGTSGTTDLMIHAFNYFGLKPKDKKILRMGLVGWMVGGRDHSFHEIFTAAEGYGEELKFNHDLSFIGSEYENKDNLSPISQSDAKKILPDKEFPSYAYTPKSLVSLSSSASYRFEETKDESEQKQKYINGVYRRLGITGEQLSIPFQAFPYMDGLLEKMWYLAIRYGIKQNLPQTEYESYAKRLNREVKLDMNYIYLANTLDYEVFFEKIYKNVIKTLKFPSAFESVMLTNATNDKNETEAMINPQAVATQMVQESSASVQEETVSPSAPSVPPPPPTLAPPVPAPPLAPAQRTQVASAQTVAKPKKTKKEIYDEAMGQFDKDLSEGNLANIKLPLMGASARKTSSLKSMIISSMRDKYCLQNKVLKKEVSRDVENKLSQASQLITQFASSTSEEEKERLKRDIIDLDKFFKWTYCSELATTIKGYDGLNDFEKKALNYYTRQGYLTMNSLKSSKKKIETTEDNNVDIKQLINDAKATAFLAPALRNMPKFRGTVYRISGGSKDFPTNSAGEFEKNADKSMLKRKKALEKKIGQTTTSSSFTSTAYDADSTYIEKDVNWDQHKIFNVIKKTESGVNIDAMSENQGEHEVLFPPGTKFKVTGVAEPKDYPELFSGKKMEGHIVLEKEEV